MPSSSTHQSPAGTADVATGNAHPATGNATATPAAAGTGGTVKVVQRPTLTFWERTYLPQILDGLRVTLRTLLRPTVTLEYPEQRPVIPAGYRGVPTLTRDGTGREKCVACQLCEFVCPARAITVTPGEIPPDAPAARVEKQAARFEIDMLRCIYCGLCQEVCPEEAIVLQQVYSTTGESRREFRNDKRALLELGGILPTRNHKWDAR
ncbi:MAG: NADH-quinone oxidoreductase subunit I [Puniceicoccales bacterium]|jgi:NADH-quinone oxidoreductase subunit I|nr:NADH-quinone oxidoreductase subunit I [Puniceicoccales bacterium]